MNIFYRCSATPPSASLASSCVSCAMNSSSSRSPRSEVRQRGARGLEAGWAREGPADGEGRLASGQKPRVPRGPSRTEWRVRDLLGSPTGSSRWRWSRDKRFLGREWLIFHVDPVILSGSRGQRGRSPDDVVLHRSSPKYLLYLSP
jgi:hypothetical protein